MMKSERSVCPDVKRQFICGLLIVVAFSFFSRVCSSCAFGSYQKGASSSTLDGEVDLNTSSGTWNFEHKITSGDSRRQFRVDNFVRLSQNEREASFESSTIFYNDYVFDFVGDNGEIVVYSFSDRKFLLFDPIRRMRAELDLDEVERFLKRVRPILRERNDKFMNFMLEPKFEVSHKENELFFQSKFIDYHIETSIFDDEVAADAYFSFINALGKLNVYMNPGTVTPLARLEANKKLSDESRFPIKIVTDVYPRGKTIFTKTIHIVNESKLARRLSERDRNRINRVAHFFAQFPCVSFKTYFEKSLER